jgi:hypothetical protein
MVIDGLHIPVIFTVVRASGGIVTQGGSWCRRWAHGGRVVASPFVAISWFDACEHASLSGSTAGRASRDGWCVLKRESRWRWRPRPCPRAGRPPHACHSIACSYTVLPARLYTALCPVEPLSSQLSVHPTSTLFIPPTRRELCCCRSSPCPQRFVDGQNTPLARRSRGAGSPLASHPFLLRRQHSPWLPLCRWQECLLES